MKIKYIPAVLALAVLFAAQAAELRLTLSRDWGYGGFDNSIQGTFSFHAEGPDDLVEVRFRIDDSVVNIDAEAPYAYQFNTDSFAPGEHILSATGLLPDGTELQSNSLVSNFLSASEAGDLTGGFVRPILFALGAIMLFGILIPTLFSRNKKHTPGVYGMAGGAVCRRCALPFSRSMLAPNMIAGKLERCPHCGKWQIAPRAGAAALAEAEARLAGEGGLKAESAETEEEKKTRLIDESRFDS